MGNGVSAATPSAAPLSAVGVLCADLTNPRNAAVVAAIFSEIMARVRKYPALSYLVVSIFPLLPGAGIYYTMSYILQNNTDAAWAKGMETASISGVMAVGILLGSTAFRMYSDWKAKKK